MDRILPKLGWIALSALGAISLAYVALSRGETINALWVVAAAVSIYIVALSFLRPVHRQEGVGLRPHPHDASASPQ